MFYLDEQKLEHIDADAFARTLPYPWLNPAGLLTDAGYQRLLNNLPVTEQLHSMFQIKRSHGQKSHDRFGLEYRDDLDVAACWHEFVAELRGEAYQRFLHRMFDRGNIQLNFHWHYTPRGCSVSPHCDARRKLGSHIFYFNTAADWDPAWGGETLILDDGGRFRRNSAPEFEEFSSISSGENLGNFSLLFRRQGNSWHGVREIHAPEGHYRKVFIVVINDRMRALLHRAAAYCKGEAIRDY